jgi:mannosyltransferase OCH1-like enzyme
MRKFNKNIFQVWYQGCQNISNENFKTNINNWKILNPDWNYYCLDDAALATACKEYSDECYEIYKSCSIMHNKIDLARYVLIYLYGGIYVDMDAYILRPLNSSSILNELIQTYEKENIPTIGLSQLNINPVESMIMVQNRNMINNAIMISSPKNPLLKKFIEYILENLRKNKSSSLKNITSLFSVNLTTGPVALNYFFNNNNNDTQSSKIFYFPPSNFEPCDFNNHCVINESTMSIHMFEQSWLSPSVRKLNRIYQSTKPYIMPSILIGMVLIYFGVVVKRK